MAAKFALLISLVACACMSASLAEHAAPTAAGVNPGSMTAFSMPSMPSLPSPSSLVDSAVDSVVSSIKSAVTDSLNSLKDGAVSDINTAITNAKTSMNNYVTTAKNTVTTSVNSARDSALQSLNNGPVATVNSITGKVKDMEDSANSMIVSAQANIASAASSVQQVATDFGKLVVDYATHPLGITETFPSCTDFPSSIKEMDDFMFAKTGTRPLTSPGSDVSYCRIKQIFDKFGMSAVLNQFNKVPSMFKPKPASFLELDESARARAESEQIFEVILPSGTVVSNCNVTLALVEMMDGVADCCSMALTVIDAAKAADGVQIIIALLGSGVRIISGWLRSHCSKQGFY